MQRPGTGLYVVEEYYRISQPKLRYDRQRAKSTIVTVTPFCAFTGRKADAPFSWYTRQYTQEDTEREKEAYLFIRIRTEDGGMADIGPPFTEDCLWGLTQWWCRDANGARRCLATGLMLPNVCIMDRKHGPVQLELFDQEHSEGIQHTEVTGWTRA